MRWTKRILIFQAVVTLIFGLIFFSQVITLKTINETILDKDTIIPFANDTNSPTITIEQRYSAASCILVFVSLIELIIIIKLVT